MSSIPRVYIRLLIERQFDIRLKISEYNKSTSRFQLPDFGREKPLAVIFGSTKQFWSKFEEFILERGLIADPVDTYYRYIIEEVVMTQHPFCDIKYEVRYDWGTPRKGNFVHVQTAGHFSGMSFPYNK